MLATSSTSSSPALDSYVKLKPSLINAAWLAKTIRAIIAPSLSYPLLLGQPFLLANSIVIDHTLRTCIVKNSNVDLLGPLPAPPSRPVPRTHKRHSPGTIQDIRDFCEMSISVPTPKASVCAVMEARMQVQDFASMPDLHLWNERLKAEFNDLFPEDIPHVNNLPDDVYHRFHLKEHLKVMKPRQYSCPRHYMDKWKTLLQQHLDKGRI